MQHWLSFLEIEGEDFPSVQLLNNDFDNKQLLWTKLT